MKGDVNLRKIRYFRRKYILKNQMKLRSGAVIFQIAAKDAEKKNYLTRQTLSQMHLMPSGDPIAFDVAPDGDIIYYFDPSRVVEAPPETWYFPRKKGLTDSTQR